MSTEPRPSQIRPHEFAEDHVIPRDYYGRAWCRWCGLPGAPGDERHPLDAPSPFPPTPAAAVELDLRRLGERAELEDDDQDQAVTRHRRHAGVTVSRTRSREGA